MQTYQWQCHVCTHSNHATLDRCEACGFAAFARGEDILRERQGGAGAAAGAAKAPVDSPDGIDELLARLPPRRRALASVSLFIAGMGALWLKCAWAMHHVWIALLMLVGGTLLAVACLPSETPPSSSP